MDSRHPPLASAIFVMRSAYWEDHMLGATVKEQDI